MASDKYDEDFGAEFQRHILAVCCRIPNFILRYRSALSHKYFTDESEAAVARALFVYADEFKSLPQRATLVELCRNGLHGKVPAVGKEKLPFVEKCLERLYAEDITDHDATGKLAVEFGKTQAMVAAVLESVDLIEQNKKDRIRSKVDEACQVGEDLLSIGLDYASEEGIAKRAQKYLDPWEFQDLVPTGIQHLDQSLHGGLGRGELGVVLAPPGKGKTTSLINFGFGALVAARRFNVVHYTLEMDKTKVAQRYDDRLMGSFTRWKRSDPAKYIEMLRERARKFVRGRLIIQQYSTRTASVSTFRSHLSVLAATGFHPDLLIVDYADIVKPERRLGEMRHEQAGIYEDLRTLAGEYNASLWSASQGKQSSLEKEVVGIGDFAESFEKAAIIDVALGFCQKGDEIPEKKFRFFKAKDRSREDNSTIECHIDRAKCYISSLGLYDSARSRIKDDGTADTNTKMKTTTSTAAAVREAAGLKAPGSGKKHDKPSKKLTPPA